MTLKKEEGTGFKNVYREHLLGDSEGTAGKKASKKRKLEDIPVNELQPRKLKNELYKPPTVEELNNLKETENLYNNNLFRLQIEELIIEVNIKNKRKKELSAWFDTFETVIDTLPEYEFQLSSIHNRNKTKSKIQKILANFAKYDPLFKTDQDILLKMKKPVKINKFGLYEHNCLPGPDAILQIFLEMPSNYFLTKDFLNYRYYTKRFYYLLYILEHLKYKKLASKINIKYHENNHLVPILEVELSNCNKCFVLIYVIPEENIFKPGRFQPQQNNVKLNLSNMHVDVDILKASPTPFYNSSLAHDITLSLNAIFIKDTLDNMKNVQEGIKLIIIWLKQRGISSGITSFSETIVVYIVVYLLQNKKLNKYMSSYQVVRNFWNFIAQTDMQGAPISLTNSPPDVLNMFKQHFDVVFLDKSGFYNLTAFLSTEMYLKMKLECDLALRHLDANKNNSFHQLFLTKIPFHLQYDVIIDLTKSLPFKNNYEISQANKAKYISYDYLLNVRYVIKILQKAFTNRISSIVPKLESDGNHLKKLLLGLNLNSEEAFSFLQKGPALNDFAAADEFRKFWGHLASDRRFRDGSTNVAVHFKTNTIKGRRNIIRKILEYVLNEKLSLEYILHYNEFEEVIISKKLVPLYPSGTNEETTLKIIHASDDLGRKLRALEMSLKITGVQGISDVFAFSDVFPPIPTTYKLSQNVTSIKEDHLIFQMNKKIGIVPRYVQPIIHVLQLEHSSKWPNNLEALCHIKTAFYLEISQKLNEQHQIISHVYTDFLEVYFEGFVFRCLLNVPKEIGLIKKRDEENGLTFFRDSKESAIMEQKLNILPKVIGALKGIYSLYPSYGPGTAIIKRWIRSQLIDDYLFPDIAINLINVSLYLDSTFDPTNTPQKSFLRFLKFFSEFDWKLQTVSVPFNEENFEKHRPEIESNLQKNREAYSNLYIIMPYDQGLSVFTKEAPSKETLCRVRQLAKESLIYFDNLINNSKENIKEIFEPNLEGYNVLIHLRPLLNPRRHEELLFEKIERRIIVEKYKESDDNKIPITGFNPVEKYLKTLRENYGKFAVFFHNSYGGNIIGVLWKPTVFQTYDFKVSNTSAMQLTNNKLVFNIDAVIEDFFIIGKDLVRTIEKR